MQVISDIQKANSSDIEVMLKLFYKKLCDQLIYIQKLKFYLNYKLQIYVSLLKKQSLVFTNYTYLCVFLCVCVFYSFLFFILFCFFKNKSKKQYRKKCKLKIIYKNKAYELVVVIYIHVYI